MDSPLIHQLVYNYILEPLLTKKTIDYKYINWDYKPPTEDDEDDGLFEETNPQFSLIALILVKLKEKNNWSWDEVTKWY